ncbi:MAG TPA: hypothetical protein VFZ53_17300 [Polyangiaceae bacterium]
MHVYYCRLEENMKWSARAHRIAGVMILVIMSGFASGGCEESPIVGGDDLSFRHVPRTVHYLTRVLELEAGTEQVCIDARVPLPTMFGSSCALYSIRQTEQGSCACDRPGQGYADTTVRFNLMDAGLSDAGNFDDFCVCAVTSVAGELAACENDVVVPPGTTGFCLVSPERGWGSPEVGAGCEGSTLRLLGAARPDEPSTLLLACLGGETLDFTAPALNGRVGDPCVPSLEGSSVFSGSHALDMAVETASPACETGICLVNHFQGRVSCPYGQTREQAERSPECFLPWSDAAVGVAVAPQLAGRRARDAAICTCMCDGPDAAFGYCDCPEEMECVRGPEWVGLPGDYGDVTARFCVPKGKEYRPSRSLDVEACDRNSMNCGDPRPY